jgi:hypothetical protein
MQCRLAPPLPQGALPCEQVGVGRVAGADAALQLFGVEAAEGGTEPADGVEPVRNAGAELAIGVVSVDRGEGGGMAKRERESL